MAPQAAYPGNYPGQPQKTSGKAIAALVLGICAICVPYVGFVVGIVAIVMGIVARKELKRNPSLKGDGLALTGLILGIVGLVLWILILTVAAAFVTSIIKQCNANPEKCKSSPTPSAIVWNDAPLAAPAPASLPDWNAAAAAPGPHGMPSVAGHAGWIASTSMPA